jgi:hypothetical protein
LAASPEFSIPLEYADAIGLIVVANVVTIWGQDSGFSIFHWDFTGTASHAQGVAWFEDGSIVRPPIWLHYSSMGFPGRWSLQSRGSYLPLQIVNSLGIKYSLFASAAFQAAHVAVGAIGVLVLLPAPGANVAAATLAALTFHFSSIFFSNAQHVDFVRGATLLPWVLHALHPSFLPGTRPRFSGRACLCGSSLSPVIRA